jgi:DEAD/DEAH box helicase domain-containing protein
MDVAAFLDRLRAQPGYAGQIEHLQELAARPGSFAHPQTPLPQLVEQLLAARGIEQLYSHQVEALEHARARRDTVVVTGTASGKTLCYHLPILEACLADEHARALYLYPTKALAQDQLKGLLELLSGNATLAEQIIPGVYDGDTPTAQRRRIKAEANLVLSNPDMLHASILPYHPKWARFFANLKYVIIDEAHTYRGILGAHVSCVLRRLQRVCEHYDARPVFIATSATIANPGELVGRLIGREPAIVDNDGAPRGRKFFALWNPAPFGRDRLAQRSGTDDAATLMVEAMQMDAQVLAFTRTRQSTELLYRYVAEELTARHSPLADKVRAYRGGYLPNERREIEQALFSGEVRGAAATNALELGVDIGSLDVALLVGYPGTIASTWQQAGRSGRRQSESLAVLIAGNDPIDHYLLRHPDYFFAQSPEHAVVDPENPYVLTKHLKTAAFELPLQREEATRFGSLTPVIAELLRDAGELNEVAGRFYYSGHEAPAPQVSLRHMSDNTFSIVQRRAASASLGDPPPVGRAGPRPFGKAPSPDYEVIATVDAISAPELIYPEAVYLHQAQTYFVRELDLDGKVAYVERREMDYYTQAVLESQVKVTAPRAERTAIVDCQFGYGTADVTWQTVAFKKIKFNTRENLGLGPVTIPAQTLATTACWLIPDDAIARQMKLAGHRTSEGLVGLRNLAIVALPMLAMCDLRDISGVVDSQNFGRSALIVYDRYPGGLGYCQRGFEYMERLLAFCQQMVAECPCEEGCPSCVGLPNLRPAIHSDPDLTRGYPMPDKAATIRLLEIVLGSAISTSTTPTPELNAPLKRCG